MVNQALLELLLDTADMFIGIYDEQQECFTKVNEFGLQLFEANNLAELSEHLNKQVLTEKHLHQLRQAFETHTKWEEVVLFTTTGKQFWAGIEANAVVHEGKPYIFLKISNIDKIKAAEREAQGKEEKFKAVFENAAIGIILTDQEGNIVLANHFMVSLFGYSPEQLLQQKVECLLPEALRSIHAQHRESFAQHPKIRSMGEGMELQGQRQDGSLFPVEVSLSYFSDKQKLYVVAFIQDISFKVEATKELLGQKTAIEKLNANLETEVVSRTQALLEALQHLEQSKSDLEKALTKEKELGELKSRFVAMASHEFRTPLSAIQSSATLISKYTRAEDQDKREKNVQRILSSVGFLTDILEEFLSLGKLEEGHIKASFALVDWKNSLADIMTDLKPILKYNQKIELDHLGDSMVYTDKSLIRKIMLNLLSNAIKFSPEGATILITSRADEDRFSIMVKDEGMGISENDLKHLFERFYRGTNAINIQGTGLGLHIVAKYVELLNGVLEIKSSLGKGTTIEIMFPSQNENSSLRLGAEFNVN